MLTSFYTELLDIWINFLRRQTQSIFLDHRFYTKFFEQSPSS